MALNKTGKALLCDLINAANGTTFLPNELTIAAPGVYVDTHGGSTRNTQVSVLETGAEEETAVTVYYTRLNLATLFEGQPMEFVAESGDTAQDILDQINAIYDTALTFADDVETFTIPAEDDIVGLQSKAGSLTCIGSVDFTITVEGA